MDRATYSNLNDSRPHDSLYADGLRRALLEEEADEGGSVARERGGHGQEFDVPLNLN